MVVDKTGAIQNDSRGMLGTWSTSNSYWVNEGFAPNYADLVKMVQRRGELVFPLSPHFDSTVFWFSRDTYQVLPVIEQANPGAVIALYGSDRGLDSNVTFTRVRRNKVTPATSFAKGLILGRLGFWEDFDEGKRHYIPRAEVRGIPDLGTVIVSPLSREEVILKGRVPMDEGNPKVTVLRMGQEQVKANFTVGALKLVSEWLTDQGVRRPIVLRFTSLRPWLGEYPHRIEQTLSRDEIQNRMELYKSIVDAVNN